MTLFVIGIALLSIPGLLHSYYKIITAKDITMFDVGALSVFLYFILIPTYYYLDGQKSAIKIVEGSRGIEALLISLIFMYMFVTIDLIFTKRKSHFTSFLNIGYQFRKFHTNFKSIKTAHALLLVIFISLKLISIIFISNPDRKDYTDTNVERIFDSAPLTIQEQIDGKLKIVYSFFFTATLIASISIWKKSTNKRLIIYAKCLICMIAVCLILSSRTDLIATTLFVLLFLYSINQRKIKFKDIIKIGLLLAVIMGIFFPVYQVYRLAKIYTLTNVSNVNFTVVIHETINNLDQLSTLVDTKNQTIDRSLNLYRALTYSLQNDKFGGWVFYESISNILPGNRPLQDNVEYQLASIYEGRGVDIADSLFMYGIADFGWVGILAALWYYYIFIYIFKKINSFFSKFNYMGIFSITFLYSIFLTMFYIENSLYFSFHNLLYVTFIAAACNALIFSIMNKTTKTINI